MHRLAAWTPTAGMIAIAAPVEPARQGRLGSAVDCVVVGPLGAAGSGLARQVARPDIAPDRALLRPDQVLRLAPRARIGFLGRSLWSGREGDSAAVYNEGLRDQVIRAQQLRKTKRAIGLAEKLVRLTHHGESYALLLEGYRLAGWRPRAQEYLRSLPRSRRENPKINIVLALFERDAGNENGARALLASVREALGATPAQGALHQPLSEWPDDLHSMTTVPRRDALVEGLSGP